MPSDQDTSKTVNDNVAETAKKISDDSRQAHEEFLKTLEEMSREVMSRAAAEVDLGLKLSKRQTAARSLPDAVSAYQEWLTEEMNARSEDTRRFIAAYRSLSGA